MHLSGPRTGNIQEIIRRNKWQINYFNWVVTLKPPETDPPGLLFPSIPLMSSIITPLGCGWDVGGLWWGSSAWWEPELLVLMDAGYWIWTWVCDRLDFTSISCWVGSTLICGDIRGWAARCCCGGEDTFSFLRGGGLLNDVAAAAIGVERGSGGTEGVALTTGTTGMTAMGTWEGGREGCGWAGGWWGCWWWTSSPQAVWLALTGWGEVTTSTCLDSASLLISSFSVRWSSSDRKKNKSAKGWANKNTK